MQHTNLAALHSGVEHQPAVLTLEALWVEVSVEGSDAGRLALSLPGHDPLPAHAAQRCELGGVALGAVHKVVAVQRELLVVQTLITDLTVEALWMKDRAGGFDRLAVYL